MKRIRALTVALVFVGSVGNGAQEDESRGVQPVAVRNEDGSLTGHLGAGPINLGTYYALLIGINQYSSLTPLRTAVKDVDSLRDILISSYGFDGKNIRLLTDAEATRAGIIQALAAYRDRPLGPSDNLLVYYAGHGYQHSRTADGFWIPVDGTDLEASWISVDDIRRILRSVRAKHTLLIADSCFSGTLTRDVVILPTHDRFLAEVSGKDSYQVITSGGLEPVADRGREGNSLFAYLLTNYLDHQRQPYITADRLFTELQPLVANASESLQTPERGKILGAFDQNGQFVFARVDLTTDIRPSAERSAGDVWVASKSGIRFRYIPAGSFTMGSPENEPGRRNDENQHPVRLTRGFWMAETEVTQGEWRRVMGENPSHFKQCGEDCPVENASWLDALKYANFLSREEGLPQCYEINGKVSFVGLDCGGFRLPTEAEWEYAARAGTTTPFWTGKELREAREAREVFEIHALDKTRVEKGEQSGTVKVRRYRPNAWGLYDAHGNVMEWVWDRYGPYPSGPVTDPLGATRGADRVARGGCWRYVAKACRSAFRFAYSPNGRTYMVGLRLVRPASH